MQLKHSSRKREQLAAHHCIISVQLLNWNLKRSVSAQGQFSPAGQSLIQPLLETYEQTLGQNCPIKSLF